MTNGELQYELRQLPADCQVWLPVWNGHVETYGVVDDVDAHHYPAIQNDFFGTPGRTDSRCFSEFRGLGRRELDETDVILISSRFGSIPQKDIDLGDDDINYDIRTINGPDGDPHLVWHLNNFESCPVANTDNEFIFTRQFQYETDSKTSEENADGYVKYNTATGVLTVYNPAIHFLLTAKMTGIEDIRRACELGCVPFALMT